MIHFLTLPITMTQVQRICGSDNARRGAAYLHQGSVVLEPLSEEPLLFRARVHTENQTYEVRVHLGHNGRAEAECSCLAFYADELYCKHTAAALLAKMQSDEQADKAKTPTTSSPGKIYLSSLSDREVVDDLLGLFRHAPKRSGGTGVVRDRRDMLSAEFTCQLFPFGNGRHLIGVSLKTGLDRLCIAHHLPDFLDAVQLGQEFPFTKTYVYQPDRQRFSAEDYAVIQRLAAIRSEDLLYKEPASGKKPTTPGRLGNERMLIIPPHAWEQLLHELLAARTVKVDAFHSLRMKAADAVSFGKPELAGSGELLPLHFSLASAEDGEGCELSAGGMHEVIVLADYGMAFRAGRFYRMNSPELHRLAKLKELLLSHERESGDAGRLGIAPEQIESFMENVVPGLMRLGDVRISEEVSKRIMYQPLKARLYLDRIRGKLLAGLEFQYGDIMINPLEGTDKPRGTERILMRDGEGERYILSLMERDSYAKTEGGYIIEGDDDEYEFLREIVPQLEEVLTVYATSAVKLRIANDIIPPKVSIKWDERTDWLEFKFELNGIPEKEIKAVIAAIEEKKPYYKLATGALMPLETDAFQAVLRVMNGMGLHQLALHGDTVKLPLGRALGLLDTPLKPGIIKLDRGLKDLLDAVRNPESMDFPIPARLRGVLRDYQRLGYQWLKTMAHYGFGGILADEMGLGKTLQSIAFLLSVQPAIRELGMPALIVAPASLMYNWKGEFARFAPELEVVIADGSKEEREELLDWSLKELSDGSLLQRLPDVIITSYPLLRRDGEQYAARQFHTLILDEAQYFKNAETQTARAVRSLRAKQRFALTGTPIENRLEELWSIFRAVFPNLLPDRREFAELTKETIAKHIRPFMLRRLKSDVVKELPEKIETVHSSELVHEQKKLYAAYLAKLQQDTLKHLDKDELGRSRIKILAGITRLRQLCCHPGLFVEGYKGSSGKFEQLMELIEECRSSGKRMLIFSQFTEMLGLIRRELGYLGISHFYLDGSTPSQERVRMCDRFNDGEHDLFLLSLKAGGTGLNLTGADTVVLYDLWWNPAVEQQAADRAHRIGQRKVVQIIRLVAKGTVEEKMVALQERKKNLIDEMLDSGSGGAAASLTEEELREILSL
ncbi:DEAD/DEAH box helicase [Paenibacillus sp. HB172176]|uniref:DEAD/DEAH box helicase n=1 Tax=Paenibacillus sp. HB172176 TaxID=2493690 RepID=UPI00143AA2C5|nr:DEAD/DEAH box helicase [Paenibacillus sp. HB172176]